jgi:hypothetical protein
MAPKMRVAAIAAALTLLSLVSADVACAQTQNSAPAARAPQLDPMRQSAKILRQRAEEAQAKIDAETDPARKRALQELAARMREQADRLEQGNNPSPPAAQTEAAARAAYNRKLAEYWRQAADALTKRAAASKSPTEKAVLAEVVAREVDRANKYEKDAEAAAVPMQPATSSPSLPGPPAPAPTPTMPQFELSAPPASPGSQGSSAPTVFGLANKCREDSGVNIGRDEHGAIDFAEMTRRHHVAQRCHAPELRKVAADYRKRAADSQASADKAWWPPAKESGVQKAAAELDAAALLEKGADALDQGVEAPAAPAAIPPSATPKTVAREVVQKDSDDPYLLCDRAKDYLSVRVIPEYTAMRERAKRYAASPALLNDVAVLQNSAGYWPIELYILISGEIPLLTGRIDSHCLEWLVDLERGRAEDGARALEGLAGNRTPDSEIIDTTRRYVYGEVEKAISDLWVSYFKEIDLGLAAIVPSYADFNWSSGYSNASDLQKIEDKWRPIINAQIAKGEVVDLTGKALDNVALCADANNRTQERIMMVSAAMPPIVAPMLAARRLLILDLGDWQEQAARSGWPRYDTEVSFRETADQLWKTRHIGEASRANYGFEYKTASYPILGPPRNFSLGGTMLVFGNAETLGAKEFFAQHDDCDVWKPRAPHGAYMLIDDASTKSRVDLPEVDQSVKDQLAIEYGKGKEAPVASAVVDVNRSTVDYLVLDLFRDGPEKAERFFLGADASQVP